MPSSIHLGVPVSNATLETQAPGGQVIEGRTLVLLCSVAEGSGNITFSWHREAAGTSLGRKTQPSLRAELEIAAVRERDAGQYYCGADNGHGAIWSKMVTVPVRSELRSLLPGRTPNQGHGAGESQGHSQRARGSRWEDASNWVTLAS